MSRALLTLIAVFALCLTALSAAAQAGANDPEIVFDPPLSVTIRQTNGAPARGEILSMNEKDLLLRAVSGKEVRIKLERVRSIKTSGETFEYWPSDETFMELCQRVDKLPGATLMGNIAEPTRRGRTPRAVPNRNGAAASNDEDPDDRRGMKKPQGRAAVTPSGDDILAKGRSSLNGLHGRRQDEAESEQEKKQPANGTAGSRNRRQQNDESTADNDQSDSDQGDNGQGDSVAVAGTIYFCSHCEKELPLSFRSGSKCPHCGQIAVFEDESASTAALATHAPAKNPFAAGGPATTPAAAPPAAAPVAAAPAAGGGMGLADVPMVAKIGIFLGLLVVGWFLLNRR
jgi:hypothetical protein